VNHEPFKNVAEGIQAVVTSVALIAGGIWALWRFVLTREGMPLIQTELARYIIGNNNCACWLGMGGPFLGQERGSCAAPTSHKTMK
jgi:hypothetical protein